MHKFISPEALNFSKQFRSLGKVQNICMAGLFMALYIALSMFNISIMKELEIRIGFLVFAGAGAFGGPVMGMIVAVCSDLLNSLVRGYPYFPGFSLSYALMGLAFGLIFYKTKMTAVRAVAGSLAEFLIASTLNTIWLHLMYGTEWHMLLTMRLIKNGITFFINIILLYVFLKAFSKIVSLSGIAVRANS